MSENLLAQIAELKRELAALKEENQALKNIIEFTPGNLYWKNTDHVYLGSNRNNANFVGLEKGDDIRGLTLYDFTPVSKEMADSITALDTQVMQSGQLYEGEEQIRGNTNVFLTQKRPLYNAQGDVIGMVGISFDITARKQMQEELRQAKEAADAANHGLTLMAGSIAHELRTPLTTIDLTAKAFARLLPKLLTSYQLAKGLENCPLISLHELNHLQEMPDLVSRVVYAAQNMINIMLMNIQAPYLTPISLKTCSIMTCITQALAEYPLQTEERTLITWLPERDFYLQGDETLIKHIVFNLMKNALYHIKAAQKGCITLWVETGSKMNKLHFKDTGKGIPAVVIPHIFERFYTTTHEGVGIGLAFCKLAMQLMGGEITCHAKENEYTEFVLSFPAN